MRTCRRFLSVWALAILCCFGHTASASAGTGGDEFSAEQQRKRTLTGTVVDINEEPLAGVAVMIDGTTTGVASGIDGSFMLSLPERSSGVLVFSSLGYVTKKVSVPPSAQDMKVYLPDLSLTRMSGKNLKSGQIFHSVT